MLLRRRTARCPLRPARSATCPPVPACISAAPHSLGMLPPSVRILLRRFNQSLCAHSRIPSDGFTQ